jgi:hypothetical protein
MGRGSRDEEQVDARQGRLQAGAVASIHPGGTHPTGIGARIELSAERFGFGLAAPSQDELDLGTLEQMVGEPSASQPITAQD